MKYYGYRRVLLTLGFLFDIIMCHTIGNRIREIPDHATFRGKGVNTGLVRQTWGMSLFGPM